MVLEIRRHYRNLELIGRELYYLHMMLVNSRSEHEWAQMQEKMWLVVMKKSSDKRRKLNWKFCKLRSQKEATTSENRERIQDERIKFVVNKSPYALSTNEEMLLANGLKYQVIPREPPLLDIVASVETAIKYLPNEVKSCLRGEISEVFKGAQYLKTRLPRGEYKIINDLKKSSLVFLEPDKGKGTVVLDKESYRDAAIEHLSSGNYAKFKPRAKFPVDSLQRRVKEGLRELKRDGLISELEYKRLIVDNPVMPSFSCMPKTHKPGNKIRPVVSNVNTPTSKISEWLVQKFRKFKAPENMSVKNSFEMAKIMSGFQIDDDELLVSFDVEALFPSVPLEEAFEMCKGWISSQDISDDEARLCVGLMGIVLKQREIEFDGEYYKQLSGLFIGNNLSSIITEVFLGRIEMEIKKLYWFPRLWMRYVDDILCIIPKKDVQMVLAKANALHPSLKFTHEIEVEGSLPFLDTRLIRNEGKIEIDVYRKPTDAPLCIPNHSHHHYSHKFATFESNVFRLCNLPLNQDRKRKELNYLMRMATINGYESGLVEKIYRKHEKRVSMQRITTLTPLEKQRRVVCQDLNGRESIKTAILPFYSPLTFKIEKILKRRRINVCYTNRGKLKDVLSNGKNKRPRVEQAGIYEIPCSECESVYRGQTKRRIETREKEHDRAIKFKQVGISSVAKHCIEEGHDRGEIRLLKKVDDHFKLDAYESIYIAKCDNLMNVGEPPMTSKLFDFVQLT